MAKTKAVIANVATPTMAAPNPLNPGEPAEQSLHAFSRRAPTIRLSPMATNPAKRQPGSRGVLLRSICFVTESPPSSVASPTLSKTENAAPSAYLGLPETLSD